MSLLVKGKFKKDWFDKVSEGGEYVRKDSQFRNTISPEDAEKGRYHLYVSYACPWAHRTLIFRKLKKLEDIISVYYKQMYPIDILKSLAKSNDLLWYYDGKVLYIYKNNEIQTGSVTLKRLSVKQFSQALRKIGILDDQFYWNEVESEGIVYFKGPERFVSAVLQMSEILDNKKPTNDKVFKWVSKSGRVHYSNINPEKGEVSIGSKVHILTKDNLYLDN